MEDRPDVHVMENDVLLKIESIKGKMTEACTQTELKGDKAAREPCISFREIERELQAMRFTLTNSSHLHKTMHALLNRCCVCSAQSCRLELNFKTFRIFLLTVVVQMLPGLHVIKPCL